MPNISTLPNFHRFAVADLHQVGFYKSDSPDGPQDAQAGANSTAYHFVVYEENDADRPAHSPEPRAIKDRTHYEIPNEPPAKGEIDHANVESLQTSMHQRRLNRLKIERACERLNQESFERCFKGQQYERWLVLSSVGIDQVLAEDLLGYSISQAPPNIFGHNPKIPPAFLMFKKGTLCYWSDGLCALPSLMPNTPDGSLLMEGASQLFDQCSQAENTHVDLSGGWRHLATVGSIQTAEELWSKFDGGSGTVQRLGITRGDSESVEYIYVYSSFPKYGLDVVISGSAERTLALARKETRSRLGPLDLR